MTNTSEIEAERRAIVAAVVAKLDDDGVELSHQVVAERIERDFPAFNYDPELDDFARDATAHGKADASAQMATGEATDTAEADESENPDALRQRIRDLGQHAADLRVTLQTLTSERQAARGALAQAIADFTRGIGPRRTRADLVREHIRQSQLEKARRAEAGYPEPQASTAGPSFLDRQSQRFGDGETFCRKQVRVGHSRGSYPSSMRGAKIPSAR